MSKMTLVEAVLYLPEANRQANFGIDIEALKIHESHMHSLLLSKIVSSMETKRYIEGAFAC